jgi:outer membrane lipoprotein
MAAEMKTANQFIPVLFFAILISGCAHVISSDLRLKVDPSLTFSEVLRDPDANKGKIMLWGGEILQVILQDRTTFVEVLKWPLGWRGNPQRTVTFEGRFVILVKEPLDSSFYQAGKRVTVAGEVQGGIKGEEMKTLSDSILSISDSP